MTTETEEVRHDLSATDRPLAKRPNALGATVNHLLQETEEMAARQSGGKDYAAIKRERDKLDAQLKELRGTELQVFREEMEARAADLEVNLQAFFAPQRKARADKGGNAVAKYRNPKNHEETWSGRGRPARWLQEYLGAGKDKEEFLIK